MGTNNNHSHLQKFQGQYYHIYHGAPLMESWRADGVIESNCGIFRSICVNKATVNESSATISQVATNIEGVTAIKHLNPYELQQAETMASCGGVDYEDITNIKKNTKISNLGNDASENMQVKMKENSWINVRNIDFGSVGAEKFTLRAKGTGTMEIRNGTSPKTKVATIEFSSTEMEEQSIDIPAGKMKGEKANLYLVVTAADNFYVDAWQFTEVGSSSISTVENSKSTKPQRYDLTGRRLTDTNQQHGIVIEQYTDQNGVKHTRKVVSGGDN
jgi:arabinoxylan arabinofuranohydrolase